MSYDGDGGEVSAVYRPMAEVEPLVRATSSVRFVAPGSLTSGRYGLFRWEMRPRGRRTGPPFSPYPLGGVLRAGGWVHAFSNRSDEAAAMLILFAPGIAREEYFKATAEIAESGRTLTAEEWTEL